VLRAAKTADCLVRKEVEPTLKGPYLVGASDFDVTDNAWRIIWECRLLPHTL
jgi:hypothetical protein